jgi:multidrug efflux pump
VFSRFFIDRPIFAAVLSIVITLGGTLALFHLPLAQFPNVAPQTVIVDCNYPGASAQVVAETVAAPIEQQVNGVEGMLYMASQCSNDGSYQLTVTFQPGVDLNMAQVLVQNRVNLALPSLPDVLKRTAVVARKKSPDLMMMINFNSPNEQLDQLYLSNYVVLHVRDELARIEGVSDIIMNGQRDYSMRVWVDPGQLAARGLTAGDVVKAIREQNMQVAAGQVGQSPAAPGQAVQITVDTLGRLTDAKQFEEIVLRAMPDGRLVRLKDVARVELGAKNQDVLCHLDRKPSVALAVYQLPEANGLDSADLIYEKLGELEQDFPEGMAVEIQYDNTPYTRECIAEVVKTLRDGVILVALVVLVFLGNWRSTLIPLAAVPVAIVGTFAVMLPLGFTINTQTLFGLVLAIGIVVDDAIVVVEAVEHHIAHGLTPRLAAIRAMEQVSGPVVAVGLVLSAVFVPCAFVSGITGLFFRQFALTIAASTIISAFNSLTLSPALAALLLRPHRGQSAPEALPRVAYPLFGGLFGYAIATRLMPASAGPLTTLSPWLVVAFGLIAGHILAKSASRVVTGFFSLFHRALHYGTRVYVRVVGVVLRLSVPALAVYGGLLVLTWWGYGKMPTGFIPLQDRGFLHMTVQLTDDASLERTEQVMQHVDRVVLGTPGVHHAVSVSGFSQVLGASGSNLGSTFVVLDDFDQRRTPDLGCEAIAARLRHRLTAEIPEATFAVLTPAPVRGVGRTGGMKLMIEDRGDLGPEVLQGQLDNLVEKGNQEPGLTGLYHGFRAETPQLYVDVDRAACLSHHVPLQAVFDALNVYFGSAYVNDFNLFGRTWQVIVQAEGRFRDDIERLRLVTVRNAQGGMVPLGALTNIRETNGPLILTRYNMYPAAALAANTAPGISSGQGIAQMEKLSNRELLPSLAFEWTEMAFLELQAGNTAMILFVLSVVMVFLVLAAQYESWSLPLAVILVVPMGLLSAIAGVAIAHMDINIFTRIGFVVLVGLASKNAVLIVQFAKQRREAGVDRRSATLEACQLRLRPILMTSFAFIMGVVPLVTATGAGAEMRRPLGTTVFAGMLGVTLFGIFLTPVFFYAVDWLGSSRLLAATPVGWVLALPLKAFAVCHPWKLVRLMKRGSSARPATVDPLVWEDELDHLQSAGRNGRHGNGKVRSAARSVDDAGRGAGVNG